MALEIRRGYRAGAICGGTRSKRLTGRRKCGRHRAGFNVEITQQVYSVYLEQVDTSLNKYLATLQIMPAARETKPADNGARR
ncbi:MAG: hypothetical protein R3C40_11660 [Parvularculaceae bacterium]